MKSQIFCDPLESAVESMEKIIHNPLLRGIRKVLFQIGGYKERAREFYFEVMLSPYCCPKCGSGLSMIGDSQCSCSCGYTFDPTIAFQQSTCCGARLVKKTFHYSCSRCHATIPSRFIFDERVFDKEYFREMMHESRERAKQKKEEIRRLLAGSRSDVFSLTEEPCLDSIPGLVADLNEFIHFNEEDPEQLSFYFSTDFHMT